MRTGFRVLAPLLLSGQLLGFYLGLTLIGSPARADDQASPLHEGSHLRVGVQGTLSPAGESWIHQPALVLMGDADISLFPIPGGGRLNGTHAEFEVAQSLSEGTDPVLNRLSVEALRWPHLRVGGFRFDRNEGTQLGIDAVGLRLPFALSGTRASRSFTILQVGGDLGYRWQSRELGAQLPAATPDAHAASVELTCRVDQLTALTDRLGLRSFEEITGILLLGEATGPGASSEPYRAGAARFAGGATLVYDITSTPSYRTVRRTHPATGVVTERWVVNPGTRIRLNLLDVRGNVDWIDTVDERRGTYTLTTGIGGDF